MPRFFTGLVVLFSLTSAQASEPRPAASSVVSHVSCEGIKQPLVIEQITYEGGKTRVVARKIAVSLSDFPRPVGKSRSVRRSYMSIVGHPSENLRLPSTHGIKFSADRTEWLWSDEQEKNLVLLDQLADEAIRKFQRKRGVVSNMREWVSGQNPYFELPEMINFREQLKKKAQIVKSRHSDYETTLASFTLSNTCDAISYTVQSSDPIELNCAAVNVSPASVESLLDEEMLVAAEWAKNFNPGLAALQKNRNEQVYLGTFTSCDGFAVRRW